MNYFTVKSRTIIIARLTMLLAIVQQFGTEIFPPEWSSYALFIVAVLMEVMRWNTDKPVGHRSPGNGFDDPEAG
jgi:hypothetical protein